MPLRPRRKNRNPHLAEGARNERHHNFETGDVSRAGYGAPRAPPPRTDRACLGLPHRIRQARDVVRERRVRSARGREGGPAFRPRPDLLGEAACRPAQRRVRFRRLDHTRGAAPPPRLYLRCYDAAIGSDVRAGASRQGSDAGHHPSPSPEPQHDAPGRGRLGRACGHPRRPPQWHRAAALLDDARKVEEPIRGDAMTYPNESIEYRKARDALLKEEQELVDKVKSVAAKRRALPRGGELKEDYVFQWANEGKIGKSVKFSELFGDKKTLLLYSFMYGPGWDNPCPSCTSLVDGFDRT